MRGKLVEDGFMIVVQPFHLFIRQHLLDNRCGVDRAEGQCLELVERAELLALFIRCDQEDVLGADAVFAFEV